MFEKFGSTVVAKIKKCEELLDMEFPQDYKQFLLETNGGAFEDGSHKFYVAELKQEFSIDVLFGLGLDRNLDVEFWYKEYADDLVECSAIIGDSMGVGLIVMIWEDDWKGIFLWDHALELEESTEDDCLYRIADDFDSFLKTLMK